MKLETKAIHLVVMEIGRRVGAVYVCDNTWATPRSLRQSVKSCPVVLLAALCLR